MTELLLLALLVQDPTQTAQNFEQRGYIENRALFYPKKRRMTAPELLTRLKYAGTPPTNFRPENSLLNILDEPLERHWHGKLDYACCRPGVE
ncbi:MAG: hypothetical protein QOJ42_5396 [Acidobacteriaceae bacterium]|nr:hypothetical protein [Acidobacteriaceae bacterium]